MQQIKIALINTIIIGFILFFTACRSQQKFSKSEEQAQQQQIIMEKELQEEYLIRVDNHKKMQSDETNKMIKKMQKENRKMMKWRSQHWFRDNF